MSINGQLWSKYCVNDFKELIKIKTWFMKNLSSITT